MIIFYYADSLGLPRAGLVGMKDRYIYLFQEWLKSQTDEDVFVVDRAKGFSTIISLYSDYKNDIGYFTGKKDVKDIFHQLIRLVFLDLTCSSCSKIIDNVIKVQDFSFYLFF